MAELAKWEQQTGFTVDDVKSWLKEERAWLLEKKQEPEEDVLKCEYVEALQSLTAARCVCYAIVDSSSNAE